MPKKGTGTAPGGSSNGSPAIQYVYFYQMDCPNAPPVTAAGDVGDLNCDQANTNCAKAGGILLLVWYRIAGTDVTPTESTNALCSQGNTKIKLTDLLTMVDNNEDDYLKKQGLDKPTVSVQPADLALVNLPAIFSTPDAGTLQMPVTDPIPGTLTIVPTYAWDFGDGTTDTPTSAGLPYDGTDPQRTPEHYPVTHTYRHAGPYTVTATVTWTATVLHLDGLGDFPSGKTRVFKTGAPITAHQAHAVLVSGQ